ncbi:hypothetical protein [Halanaeroarchaeum sp. HSR-CO]|nr:hypothetical protein [Halanaeroarchaeum sp. HSR-CO]
MIDLASTIEFLRSVSPVAFVLGEALVLYGVTGVLFDRTGSTVKAAIKAE